ncbi:RNA polymerase sigma factor [Gelidibacter salicanalis]|uniref:RNA polymerase sigma factor n=1 Tax=Gelidibacter salicanalis TaxID=291193 RepID=A0A5C7AQ24_9FLAO|nr:RNA polymerase sigma factor [Gelidibacter salicanalis]TXE10698.1 RNA polymerase sigma factor [Gelidibacter salicanalis]
MTQTNFLKLVMPFKDKIYRLSKRLLVSKEEAEDATQEILLKLWKNNNSIEKYANVEAFSMTMTKNLCLDRLKSKQAQNLKIVHSNYQDHNVSLQQQIENTDSVHWVSKIMDELPEQQKIIVQLRDIEDYDFSDIAKVLDMNETAVRVALSRARKTIREQLTNKHSYGLR